jgi:hypothetical protein
MVLLSSGSSSLEDSTILRKVGNCCHVTEDLNLQQSRSEHITSRTFLTLCVCVCVILYLSPYQQGHVTVKVSSEM